MRVRHLWLMSGLLLTGGLAFAADWPRFRGPNGTGVAADKGVPVRWTADNVLWKTPIPGAGHSSPIISGGKVFLESATREERLLICVDAASGKVVWKKAAPGGAGRTHRKNSLASSTPAADGKRVYALFWDGRRVGLYAYDFKGKPVWNKDLGPFNSQHGPGFSPIVHGGRVFVNNDNDDSASLLAFDAKDGKKLWEKPRKVFRACYSTPFVCKHGSDAEQLIVASTAGITGYNPRDGKVVWDYTWSFPGMALRTVGSPITADGVVVACSGDGSGLRGMIGVRLGGSGDVTKTHLAWEKDSKTPYVPTPVALGKHFYTVTDDGFASCYEARSGKEVWRTRLGGATSASPVLIDGKVYAINEAGTTYVFAASANAFKLLATNKLGEGVFSTPAVSNNRLYVRGRKHLFCIGKPAR
jgi:outer membrane protein assembly factor BamB